MNSQMVITVEKLRDPHSRFHFPDALIQGVTGTTEMYELRGDHIGSTDEVLFAKMDNGKVSSFTRTTTFWLLISSFALSCSEFDVYGGKR